MASNTIGDRWAFGPPQPLFGMSRKHRGLKVGALTVVFALVGATLALADTTEADGDTAATGQNDVAFGNVCVNTSKTVSIEMWAKATGRSNPPTGSPGNNMWANGAVLTGSFAATALAGGNTATSTSITPTAPASTITLPGDWLSKVNNTISNKITASVQLNAGSTAGSFNGTLKPTLTGSGYSNVGGTPTLGTLGRTADLNFTATVLAASHPDCAPPPPTNTAPDPGTISGDTSVDEATTGVVYTSDASDPDSDPITYAWSVSGNATIAAGQGTSSVSLDFQDGCSTCTATLSLDVSDGQETASAPDLEIQVNNLPPVVEASFANGSVDCGANATLDVEFDDPYDGDADWTVDIDWDDGSSLVPSEVVNSETNGTPIQYMHSYTTPGDYTAVVTVTDRDGASDNGAGTDDAEITITQEYSVSFKAPFDTSNPSRLITNKMKNGRVVPVKAMIYDVCTGAYITDADNLPVSIGVRKTSDTAGTIYDGIEQYADAGASNGNTQYFRWSTDGFWIYNLDSKALGLSVNSTYRVDVYVGNTSSPVKATDDEWALLMPVK